MKTVDQQDVDNAADFDAAVTQLHRGNVSNALKFGAILVLTFIGFFSVTYLALTAGEFVTSFFAG